MIFLKQPVNAEISSPFGDRVHPITGELKLHNGVDYSVPTGTAIIAPAAGTVKSVYYNSTGGNQLIVDHAFGWRSGYAHLSNSIVNPGEKVRKGQVIAYSGNTGGSTGPHLHFTLKRNDEYKDPQAVFKTQSRIKILLIALALIVIAIFVFKAIKKR